MEKNELLIVLFYGVSCLGKTTFSEFVHQESLKKFINFKRVSLDEVATDILRKFKEENPSVTDNQEVFFKCWAEINSSFDKEIFSQIAKSKPGKNLIFIDDGKIDPAVISKLESPTLLDTHHVKLVAIYPHNTHNFNIDGENWVPFSPQLILNLLLRCLKREAHETMDYIPEKLLQIVLSFTLLYRNVSSFRQHFLQEANFTEMLEIPFHQEKNLSDLKPSEDQCCKITSEGLKNFEEFEQIARACYLSIKAPFEDLKSENMGELTQLVKFLNDQAKIESMDFVINYGEKARWQQSSESILSHFSGLHELEKENNINRGN